MATNYKAPAYSNKYRNNINTSYYEKAKDEFNKQAETTRNRQISEAQNTLQSNLKQAYVTRLQDQQRLNNNLATSGIRGGATETANLNIANQYANARGTANANYSNSVNQINNQINQSKFENTQNLNSQKEQYVQNLAQAKWQAAREDKTNEVQRQTEYWNNYYTNFYSGYTKKDAKKAYEYLSKQLKNATNPYQKIKLQQAISGVKARIGVINNKK